LPPYERVVHELETAVLLGFSVSGKMATMPALPAPATLMQLEVRENVILAFQAVSINVALLGQPENDCRSLSLAGRAKTKTVRPILLVCSVEVRE